MLLILRQLLITLSITLILTCKCSNNSLNYPFVDVLLTICYNSTELGRLPHVKTAAHLMKTIVYKNKDSLSAGLIVGGWDPYEGGQLYEIPLGGSLVKQTYCLGGSGSGYIYGLVDSLYREGLNKEDCKNLIKRAISHAMSRDGSSGGVVRLVVIDQKGVEKEVIMGDQLPYFA